MPTRKLLGAAAFSAALAAGGVAGALFGTPVLSGAQESDSSTTAPESSPPESTPAAPPEIRHRAAKGAQLSAAAEALGMTEEELRTELAAGKSIADVAADKGVDKQKVIDAMVAEASAALDAAKAALPERIAALVEQDGLPFRGPGGRGGPGHGPGHHRGMGVINSIDDAATALGISRQELIEELESGKSIAQIAEEKGKNLDDVKAAMVADANARIDRAVGEGQLTAEKAAELKAGLAEKVDNVVQQEGLPMRGQKRFGPPPGEEAPVEGDNASFNA
jgi:uncharacterized protein (DUF433 family)